MINQPTLLLILATMLPQCAQTYPAPALFTNLAPKITQQVIVIAQSCAGVNGVPSCPDLNPPLHWLSPPTGGGGNRYDGRGNVYVATYQNGSDIALITLMNPSGVFSDVATLNQKSNCTDTASGPFIVKHTYPRLFIQFGAERSSSCDRFVLIRLK